MKTGVSLIDRASKRCGGDKNLALALGITRSMVSKLRHGQRRITPSQAYRLAEICGNAPDKAAVRVVKTTLREKSMGNKPSSATVLSPSAHAASGIRSAVWCEGTLVYQKGDRPC